MCVPSVQKYSGYITDMFPLLFAHVPPIILHVSLGISHVAPGVSPYFLF